MTVATDIEIHPLADLIPRMSDAEYRELRDDIATNGLLDPIVLYEGKILDGRHRYRACMETGRAEGFEDYRGENPASFVISKNLHRRHLTTGQRAAIAVDFLPALELEARKRQGARNDLTSESPDTEVRKNSRSYREAGEAVGVGEATVGRAKRVKREAPEEFEKLRSGETTVTKALATIEPKPVANKSPFVIRGKRGEQVAEKAKQRVERVVGTCGGLTRGLPELNVDAALAVATPEEVKGWLESFKEASAAIKQLRRRLEEAS